MWSGQAKQGVTVMSSREAGVSFFDVRDWANQTAFAHHCFIHFEMHVPQAKNAHIAWHVRCVARWLDAKGKVVKERGESGQWPTNDAKTFAGLELLLLSRLERKLEQEEMDAQRAALAQPRLRGF